MSVRIVVGDCRETLPSLPDDHFHTVVTSPPCWGLRAYGGESEMIGMESSLDEHLASLVEVFREVRRVLRPDGTVWLNYGDAYASSTVNGTFRPGSNRADGNVRESGSPRNRNGTPTPAGLKPKDLMLMSSRLAIALQEDGVPDAAALEAIERAQAALVDAYDGELPDRVRVALERLDAEYRDAKGDSWWVRSEIVWHKPNPMPESIRDRPTASHEKVWLLTRSARYFYDATAVRTQTDRGGFNGTPRPSEGRKPNRPQDNPVSERRESSANLRNVWTVATRPYREAHFATFPPALVEPCIKAGTSERGCCAECGAPWVRVVDKQATGRKRTRATGGLGQQHSRETHGLKAVEGNFQEGVQYITTGWRPTCDCAQPPGVPCRVLDPFGGAGTVGLMAQRLGRDATILELNAEYAEMARNRTVHNGRPQDRQPDLLADVTVIS